MTGKNLFKKKVSDFKCSASEGLACFPVLRAFLQTVYHRIRSAPARSCAQCFFALCEVLDLLQVSATGQLNAGVLDAALRKHFQLYLGAYGAEAVLPKGHFALHLPDSLRRHGLLLSCFVHERRHKEVKRFANQLTSMKAGSERHVLEMALEKHMQNLATYTVGRDGLENPRPAPHALCETFCDFFSLQACPGLETSNSAAVGQGRLCKRGDVVVIEADNGHEVAQVWLHVAFAGHEYSFVSIWQAKGNSRFRMENIPTCVQTRKISMLCVHRPEGADALVVPLKPILTLEP